MKNYLLFAGRDFYPVGGADDFQGSYDTLSKAIKEGYKLKDKNWFHIHSFESKYGVGCSFAIGKKVRG